MNYILGVLSGIAISSFSAFITNIFTKKRQQRKMLAEKRFEIYMKFLELYGMYWWVVSAELKKELPSIKVRRGCFSLAWEIADLVRYVDEIEYLEDILRITHGNEFDSASDRFHAMEKLIAKFGKIVNPIYSKIIKKLNEENLKFLASGGRSNAPERI